MSGMSFKDDVRNAAREQQKTEDEKFSADSELIRAAAEFNYERIKSSVMKHAQDGKFSDGVIKDVYAVSDKGGKSFAQSKAPYGEELFRISSDTVFSHKKTMFSQYDEYQLSYEVKNVATLKAVCDAMKKLAAEDEKTLSEPFLQVKVYSPRTGIEESRVFIENGSLSHSITYRKTYVRGARTGGESGEIRLAVEYSFNI